MLRITGPRVPVARTEHKKISSFAGEHIGLPQSASVALLFQGALVSGSPVQRIPMQLHFSGAQRKLMTLNAENMKFDIQDVAPPRRLITKNKALARVILMESPDVIALQEVGDLQTLVDFNRKFLKGAYPNIFVSTRGNQSQRVALMSKRNVHMVEQRSHWNTQSGGNLQDDKRRDLLEATFETDTGYRFTVYTGHFKSMRGDERETHVIRQKEAENTARLVAQRLQAKPDDRVVVTGDFNTKYHTLLGKQIVNILSLKHLLPPDQVLQEVTMQGGQKPQPTNRTQGFPDVKLDYQFISKGLQKELRKAYVAGVFHKWPWKVATDHLPVVMEFEEPDDIQKEAPSTVPRLDQTA